MDEAKRQAYKAGQQAYRDQESPLHNPHAPAPPGDPTLCRLWRQGWQAARREDNRQNFSDS